MARPYICGYMNLDDYTYYDVPSPDPPAPAMVAWVGERVGLDPGNNNGMKAKMDYAKNLWFIACDDPSIPRTMYLVRATRRIDDLVDLAYKQIPLVDGTYVPLSNQITIDQWGNVYFPTGYITGGTPGEEYWVAKVTSPVNPMVDDPADWTITWHVNSKVDGSTTGCWGISLSKSHATLVTYVDDGAFPDGSDYLAVLNTTTMVSDTHHLVNTQIGITDPYNIETDVSGLGNNNWAFLIRGDVTFVLTALNMTNPAAAHVDNDLEEQTERTVSIKTDGTVVTGDPTSLFETAYPVIGNGVLDDGVPNAVGAPERMNHADLVRATPAALINTRYWAFGNLGGAGGQVKEVTDALVENTRVAETGYRYLATAAEREAYT